MAWFEFQSGWKAPTTSSPISIRRYAENWQHSHSIVVCSVFSGGRYEVIYLAVSNLFLRVWSLKTFGAMVKVLDTGVQARMAIWRRRHRRRLKHHA
jgi:hypothetical protein